MGYAEMAHLRGLREDFDEQANAPSANPRYVTRTTTVEKEWWQSLPLRDQMLVRGAGVSRDSRKAILLGRWAAVQHGMWIGPFTDWTVDVALPSGKPPAKSKWPYLTRFRSVPVRDDETITAHNIRYTDRLRTYIDLFRFGTITDQLTATDWLLSHYSRRTVHDYIDGFEGCRPEILKRAHRMVAGVTPLPEYRYSLARAVLSSHRIDCYPVFLKPWVTSGPLIVDCGGMRNIAIIIDDATGFDFDFGFPEDTRASWTSHHNFPTVRWDFSDLFFRPDLFMREVGRARNAVIYKHSLPKWEW